MIYKAGFLRPGSHASDIRLEQWQFDPFQIKASHVIRLEVYNIKDFMIISFIIDTTLIPHSTEFEVEKKTTLTTLKRAESLSMGPISWFKSIESKGHEIWISTTSIRSKQSLKRTFMAHGLCPLRITNQTKNQRV